jgi:NAD+ synthetase
VVGFVDRNARHEGRDFHNAAALLAEGRVQGVIHKTLLPTYDVFDEDRYFERAGEVPVIPFRGRTVGLSICEDAWSARDLWPRPLYAVDPIRNLVERGADLLINISASPFETGKPRFRRALLREQARKYRVPLIYTNLVGGNDDLVFDGHSLALGRGGNLIAGGRGFEEEILVVDPDSERDEGFQETSDIELLLGALTLGTRDYARKCGFRSAVLGLSGGIDSAVVACIAAEALGPDNVLGVAMPSIYSAPESESDAAALARNLGIRQETIPIRSVYDAFRGALEHSFAGLEPDVTEENLQARIRGTILMALSNKFGHLVLSTGNKSELGVGYCTLYGDMAGGLAVISDVPKTMVYALARHINRQGERIPQNTLVRPPTAELRPDQTDQDTLPEYDILDGILKARIEERMGFEEIVARGYDRETVRKVLRMIYANEYKRRQAAPGLKVTSRAFGPGRRMPIAMKLDL